MTRQAGPRHDDPAPRASLMPRVQATGRPGARRGCHLAAERVFYKSALLHVPFVPLIQEELAMSAEPTQSQDAGLREPSDETLLRCLDMEWQDHFQTRAQTWKALEIEGGLAAAMLGVNLLVDDRLPAIIGACLLIAASWFGAQITYRHREVERRKFAHIIEIEKQLGMVGPGRVFHDVRLPSRIYWYDPFVPWHASTPLFILRMHLILLVVGVLVLGFALF